MPRDPRRPEDVDTKAEDHAYDALRYLIAELERHGPQQGHSERVKRPKPGEDPHPGRRAAGRTTTTTGGLGRADF